MLAFTAALTILAGFAVATPVQKNAERQFAGDNNGDAAAASSPTSSVVITQSLTAGQPVASGTGAATNNMQIKQGERCAMVFGPLEHGMPVVMGECANSGSHMWTIFGKGQIQATGTDLCIDATSDPKNGEWVRLWECQEEDQFLFGAVEGQIKSTKNNQCLNVDAGNGAKLQTWECQAKDKNELFLVAKSPDAPKTVSIPVRTSITAAAASPTSTYSAVVTTTKV